MTAHQLISEAAEPPAGSRHTCPCGWEVYTYTRPGNPATTEAVQDAYARHLNPQAGLPMPRPNTPDVITAKPGPNGTIRRTRKVRVKRCCDGCGEVLGDVTDAELEAAVTGRNLPSVIAEHGCQAGAD